MNGYQIRDSAGELVAIHERIAEPDGGKRFVWRQPDGTSGLNGMPVGSMPLYGVHLLNGRSTVVIVEGEKAADSLISAGVPAVGTVTGAASCPGRGPLAELTGRDVVLWADNDDVGRAHMEKVAAGLVGIAASVRQIDWPDAPDHGDAADFAGDPWDLIDTAAPIGPAAPTYRTLADIDDAPPAPLILGLLEPTGPTLGYAAPGVGKGTTGAWIIRECQALGMRPAIYDAETRPREWSRRCAGLGVDRSRVAYVTPADLGPKYPGRPLWESAPVLGKTLEVAGADLLLVDSILPACAVGEDRLRSDAQTPFLFVAALEALGIPSLSFGHTPKGSPEGDPFGSFAWIAAMRLTWIGARAEGDGHRVRWRPRKRNERGHLPGVLLSFAYDDGGRLCGVTREDDEESTRDRLLAALVGLALAPASLVADDPGPVSASRAAASGAILAPSRCGKHSAGCQTSDCAGAVALGYAFAATPSPAGYRAHCTCAAVRQKDSWCTTPIGCDRVVPAVPMANRRSEVAWQWFAGFGKSYRVDGSSLSPRNGQTRAPAAAGGACRGAAIATLGGAAPPLDRAVCLAMTGDRRLTGSSPGACRPAESFAVRQQ